MLIRWSISCWMFGLFTFERWFSILGLLVLSHVDDYRSGWGRGRVIVLHLVVGFNGWFSSRLVLLYCGRKWGWRCGLGLGSGSGSGPASPEFSVLFFFLCLVFFLDHCPVVGLVRVKVVEAGVEAALAVSAKTIGSATHGQGRGEASGNERGCAFEDSGGVLVRRGQLWSRHHVVVLVDAFQVFFKLDLTRRRLLAHRCRLQGPQVGGAFDLQVQDVGVGLHGVVGDDGGKRVREDGRVLTGQTPTTQLLDCRASDAAGSTVEDVWNIKALQIKTYFSFWNLKRFQHSFISKFTLIEY